MNYLYMQKDKKSYATNNQEDEDVYDPYSRNANNNENLKEKENTSSPKKTANRKSCSTKTQFRRLVLSHTVMPVRVIRKEQ